LITIKMYEKNKSESSTRAHITKKHKKNRAKKQKQKMSFA